MLPFSKRGLPVDPEVKLLTDRYHDLKEGDQITHKEIEQVIGRAYPSARYRGVVTAWREKLMAGDPSLILKSIAAVGYVVADPTGRIDLAVQKTKTASTYLSRAGFIAASTDRSRLNTEERNIQDHIVRCSSTMQAIRLGEARPFDATVLDDQPRPRRENLRVLLRSKEE